MSKEYTDYGIDDNGYMVMVSVSWEKTNQGLSYNINYLDHKKRKISVYEKLRNKMILMFGGKLDYKYTRRSIF